MKFLVVDDSAVDRHLMVSLLERLGHDVDVCQDANNLSLKIENGNYSAVILDIVMPGEDGFKSLRAIRSNPTTAQQYVIFCSSKKTPLEIKYGLTKCGANDYITKPVDENVLASFTRYLFISSMW